jgi:signal transduction histidine kinase
MADRRTERALVAYVRQELSAPATAVMGYAEMLMDDAGSSPTISSVSSMPVAASIV